MLRPFRVTAAVGSLFVAGGLLVGPVPQASAGPQGGLRVLDATLVRDGTRWISPSGSELLSSPNAKACAPGDPVWQNRFAHVPYRIGPRPDQLGDCWAGDLMPGGPGSWADAAAGSVGSPSMAKIGDIWYLFYTARKSGSQQRCIGAGVGNQATGPGWIQGAQPLVCPPSGSAVDPEIFRDRRNGQWLLLWRQDEDAQGCQTGIRVQEFSPSTGLVGASRTLLSASSPALGFDEIGGATACPGGVRHLIESPSMVRADDGNLWLFFSANDRNSREYATGWALCGTGLALEATCNVLNGFDPAGRYRPSWGAADRTAPVSGVNAKPYLGFPSMRGFGGLSLAVADPMASGVQPVYTTAQMYWGGDSQLHTQVVLRVDASWTVPALYESEAVTWHGKPLNFGPLYESAHTASGQSLSTRGVEGFAWPGGHNGIFNTVTADGTVLVAGGTYATNAWNMGAYDPRTSEWTNIEISTSTGRKTISPLGDQLAGGSAWDIRAFGDGNQAIFTNLFSLPAPYFTAKRATPDADGVWPAFGVIAKRDGRWQVVSQWTGAELRRSVPRENPNEPSISERACPLEQLHRQVEVSMCGLPNEVSVLPRSKDLIVALYGNGLMALRVTGPDADGRYQAVVRGFYDYPDVRDLHPPAGACQQPQDPVTCGAAIAPKVVKPDPTSQPGDERFVVSFDMFRKDDGNAETLPEGLQGGGIQEFSYDSATGTIKPVSAQVLIGDLGGNTFGGLSEALYDHQGNLWAQGAKMAYDQEKDRLVPQEGTLVLYAKTDGGRKLGGSECPFNQAQWEADPTRAEYTITVGGRTYWGQTCRPDYEILQRKDFSHTAIFDPFLQMAEDPITKTMVGVDTWVTGDIIGIRHSGSGRSKTFTIGNIVDTGRNALPKTGLRLEQRPPSFDKTGRMWIAPMQWPIEDNRRPRPDPLDHWIASVEVARLFDPAPVVLPTDAGQTANIQAEQTITFGTTQRPDPAGTGTILVDSATYVDKCLDVGCVNDNLFGEGYMLADDTPWGHQGGPVEYRVYVPAPGTYKLKYHVITYPNVTGARITFEGGGAIRTTPVNTPDWKWTVKEEAQAITLPAGTHTIRLSSPSGGGGWFLNWFSLTRE